MMTNRKRIYFYVYDDALQRICLIFEQREYVNVCVYVCVCIHAGGSGVVVGKKGCVCLWCV